LFKSLETPSFENKSLSLQQMIIILILIRSSRAGRDALV